MNGHVQMWAGGNNFMFLAESNRKPIVTITHDGRVELGEGCTNEDAAQAFIAAVREQIARTGWVPDAQAVPLEMRICELPHIILKPNQPYIFTVDPNCDKCRASAAYATGAPAQGIDLGPFTRLADAWVLAAHDAGERGKSQKEAIMLMAVKELRDIVVQVQQRDAAPGVKS